MQNFLVLIYFLITKTDIKDFVNSYRFIILNYYGNFNQTRYV